MGKWIDADALKVDFYDEYETEDDAYAYEYVSKRQIDSAPSIDIVRCKECKWAKARGTYQWCGRLDSTARITADDFCSYGEREDER